MSGSFASDAALTDDTPMARSLAEIEGMLSGGDRQSDPRKAVAKRATKLLGELQGRDHP